MMKFALRWLSILALLCTPISALAATTPNSFITAQTPRSYKANIVNASGVVTLAATTNYVTLATGATNGTIINSVLCASNDTATHNLVIGQIRSSTLYPMAVIAIAAGSTTSLAQVYPFEVPSLSSLPYDPDGNTYQILESGDTLVVGVLTTAVTAALAISCTTNGADY
jgi:hypothetical protein